MNKTRIITENNDYIIELERKPSFFYPNRSLCNITFKTILEKDIATIHVSDIELVNFIDNLSTFIELESDIIYSFNLDNTDNILYAIGFHVEYNDILLNNNLGIILTDNEKKYIMTLYSFKTNIENCNKLLSIDITNSYNFLLDELYDTFIEPNDESMKKYLLNL